jgi:hypothetical protein
MIQYADGDSEDRPRLFSSYFKEDQSREKEKSKEEETATLAKFAARRKGQQRAPSSQQKENTRVVELEATIRRIRIGIVVGFGLARLLQLQFHTQSSHLLVCRRVFRDHGVGVVVVKG